jgi:hypothetical protein
VIRLVADAVVLVLCGCGTVAVASTGTRAIQRRQERKRYDSALARELRIAALETELGVMNPVYAHTPDSASDFDVVELEAPLAHERVLEQYEAVIATFQRRAAITRAAIKRRPHERDRYEQ